MMDSCICIHCGLPAREWDHRTKHYMAVPECSQERGHWFDWVEETEYETVWVN